MSESDLLSEKRLKVIFWGTHPDDLEIYMGGTIAKYVEKGHEVVLILSTDGCRGGREIRGKELSDIRKREAKAAAAHLGLTPLFMGFEDSRMVHDTKTLGSFAETMDRILPDLVFTHSPKDYHNDHRVTSSLVSAACVKPVFFADTAAGVGFKPQYYVDITGQFDTKHKMICEHRSQDGKTFADYMRIQNRFRALQCFREGVQYAEAYRVFERFGSADLYRLLP
jgi:N-acetylglucosamine malate deacetylase 1